MFLRLKLSDATDEFTTLKFYENPKGTCLASSCAIHITPRKVPNKYPGREKLSFWHIDDRVLEEFYGERVCINSLLTYPGVVSVKVILRETDITNEMISWLSDDELYEMLQPYM